MTIEISSACDAEVFSFRYDRALGWLVKIRDNCVMRRSGCHQRQETTTSTATERQAANYQAIKGLQWFIKGTPHLPSSPLTLGDASPFVGASSAVRGSEQLGPSAPVCGSPSATAAAAAAAVAPPAQPNNAKERLTLKQKHTHTHTPQRHKRHKHT